MIRRTLRDRRRFAAIALGLGAVLAAGIGVVAQGRRDFDISSRRYAFTVSGDANAEIHVTQNELVHITFSAEDIPHSFAIDEPPYRIMKRAEPGKPVTFDFRADAAGKFRFFCNLTADSKCKDMHGTLVVERAR